MAQIFNFSGCRPIRLDERHAVGAGSLESLESLLLGSVGVDDVRLTWDMGLAMLSLMAVRPQSRGISWGRVGACRGAS